MTTEFEVIANKLLTARGKELNEQQQEKLGTILQPLNDKIQDFEKQVREAYETEGKERHLLKSEVAKLVEQNQRLSKDADNLTKALEGRFASPRRLGRNALGEVARWIRSRERPGIQHAGKHYARRWFAASSGCRDLPAR